MLGAYEELIQNACMWLKEQEEKGHVFYLPQDVSSPQPYSEQKKDQEVVYSFPEKLKASEIILLDFQTMPEEEMLLQRLSSAIDERIAPACYYTLEKLEPSYLKSLKSHFFKARWILFSEPKLYLFPKLAAYYKKQPDRTLFDQPLFFLGELNVYDQNPELKKNLWSTLLQTL